MIKDCYHKIILIGPFQTILNYKIKFFFRKLLICLIMLFLVSKPRREEKLKSIKLSFVLKIDQES